MYTNSGEFISAHSMSSIRSRQRGKGSAIFLHVARPGYQPTEGCIALKRRDLIRLLPYLRKGTVFRVSRN